MKKILVSLVIIGWGWEDPVYAINQIGFSLLTTAKLILQWILVIYIVYIGAMMIMSMGNNEEQLSNSKRQLWYTLIGLLFINIPGTTLYGSSTLLCGNHRSMEASRFWRKCKRWYQYHRINFSARSLLCWASCALLSDTCWILLYHIGMRWGKSEKGKIYRDKHGTCNTYSPCDVYILTWFSNAIKILNTSP